MPIHLITSIAVLFLITTLGFFVLLDNHKNYVNRIFFILCLSITLWIFNNILVEMIRGYSAILLFTRITIIWVLLLPIFFNELIANLYFSDNAAYQKRHRVVMMLSLLVTYLIIILSQTNFNVRSISIESWGVGFQPGIAYYILLVYLLASFGFSLFHLYGIYRKVSEPNKSQVKMILIGSFLAVLSGILMDIILPLSGNSFMTSFAPSTIIFFVIPIFFAVWKHRLFNIEIIAVQLVICALWTLILMRVVVTKTLHDFLVEGSLFIIVLVMGILLIQSILQGIKHRKEIDDLTVDLKKAYKHIEEINLNIH